jgi:NAD(P)-dependent dehydrogenase (short-subunit alcohol dehydrogenase family)
MRTWFITGAARGLGLSLAKRALESGDSVVLATMQDPVHVGATLGAALGAHERLLVVPLEVSHEAHTRAAVAAGLRRFGRIDVLVNNVGYDLLGAIEEASAAEVERVFRCNVFGLLTVTRAVLPQLRRQGSGHIVNMSSVGSHRAGAGWGIYCAIKSAVEAISEALSMEGEPLGIHTTLVESGYVRRNSLSARPLVSAVQRIDDYRETVGPMRTFAASPDNQQPGDPDALAAAILSLVEVPDPPRRLPLGTATFRPIEKHKPVMQEHDHWRSLVLPIDFAN